MEKSLSARVVAVSVSGAHTMSKPSVGRIRLLEGLGVEGDAHMGATVKHRSRVARDPTQPNLRQVHLIHAEFFDELRTKGFDISPGLMGENVTTGGINILALPAGALLHLGGGAIVKVTGLRNPCYQLDGLQQGLMQATLERDAHGGLVRKAGVMAIVIVGGEVAIGDAIRIERPPGADEPLKPV